MGQTQATGTAPLTLPQTLPLILYRQTSLGKDSSHIHLPTVRLNQRTLPSSKSLQFSLLSRNWR